MTGVEPASIEGDWRVASDEEPGIGPVFTLRRGHVFQEGTAIGVYTIKDGVLTFTKTARGADDRVWTTVFAFELPGAHTNPEMHALFGKDISRPDRLPGHADYSAVDEDGRDIAFGHDCALFRVE